MCLFDEWNSLQARGNANLRGRCDGYRQSRTEQRRRPNGMRLCSDSASEAAALSKRRVCPKERTRSIEVRARSSASLSLLR